MARLANAIKKAVTAATVRFPGRGGQGVLVRAGFIVTAAHVIEWSHDASMMFDDARFVQPIEAAGRKLLVYPLAVEPVADLAVLGALDDQSWQKESAAFEHFCEVTPALVLNTAEFPYDTPIPAHTLTHTGHWVSGHVFQFQPQTSTLFYKTVEGIQGGTSGGPVVTDDGRLVGVLSTAGGPESGPARECSIPRPHLAAPVWLVQRMMGNRVNKRWFYVKRKATKKGIKSKKRK